MEQYIPYSLICDLFSRDLETYLHCLSIQRREKIPRKNQQNSEPYFKTRLFPIRGEPS